MMFLPLTMLPARAAESWGVRTSPLVPCARRLPGILVLRAAIRAEPVHQHPLLGGAVQPLLVPRIALGEDRPLDVMAHPGPPAVREDDEPHPVMGMERVAGVAAGSIEVPEGPSGLEDAVGQPAPQLGDDDGKVSERTRQTNWWTH